jgi:HD-like signal output (HDOD) protein
VDIQTLALQIARSEQLPVLPQVIVAVLRLATSEDASARRLEAILKQDPALAARVLKVANSAHYGLQTKVHSIAAATQLLGTRTLQSIVVSVAYHQAMEVRSGREGFDRVAFWRHCLGVASIARRICSQIIPEMVEELYTIGLLHDVGMLAISAHYPSEYDRVVQVSRTAGIPLEVAERHVFSFDSCEIGALMAERWGFGPIAETAIRDHLRQDEACAHPKTTGIIAVSNALAHEAGLTNQSGDLKVELPQIALDAVGLTPEQIEEIRREVTQIIAAAEETYGIRQRAA